MCSARVSVWRATLTNFRFPQSFRELVIANNAGYPNKDVFDTDNEEGRTFHSLLSFNREDKDNIFDYYDWSTEDFEELGWQYIEFASSCFGDPIAFDPRTGHIIFVDHETLNTELIAETFDEFLENLYDYDEREAILRDSPAIFSVPLPTQPAQDPTGQNAEKNQDSVSPSLESATNNCTTTYTKRHTFYRVPFLCLKYIIVEIPTIFN